MEGAQTVTSQAPPTSMSSIIQEKVKEEKEVSAVVPSPAHPQEPTKPQYATHEEAKQAFKELLRDKVRRKMKYV